MNEYIKHGIYCKRGKYLTEKRKAYYESMKQNKLNAYIRKNKERTERMKKDILNDRIKK